MKKNIYSFFKYQIFMLLLLVVPFMSGFSAAKINSFITSDKGATVEENVPFRTETGQDTTNIYYLKTTQNNRLFCLSPGVMYYGGVTYNNPELISGTGIICGLIEVSYGALSAREYDWENLSDEDYVMFQKALWLSTNFSGTCSTEVAYEVANYGGTPEAGKLDVSIESNSFTKQGDYYVSSEIIVDKANLLNSNKYDLQINSTSDEVFAVTSLDNIQGTRLTNASGASSFYIVIPVGSINENLSINVNLSGEYVASETFYNKPVLYKYTTTDTTNPENQVVGIIENHNYSKTTTSTIEREFTLNYNVPTSTLTIVKKDVETENPIKGVKFVLLDKDGNRAKKADGTEVGELETDNEGKIVISNLLYGNYDIQEVSVPEGYILNSEKLPIVIDGATEEVVVTNVPVDITKILKVDSVTGKPLAGAGLYIYDENGEDITEFISTEEIYEMYLSPGVYTLAEMSSPEGYDSISHQFVFQVTNDGNIIGTSEEEYYELKEGIIYVYNTPTPEEVVEVPDTGSNMYLYFIIGGGLLALGSVITITLYRRKKIVDQI